MAAAAGGAGAEGVDGEFWCMPTCLGSNQRRDLLVACRAMRRNERIASMLERARELAGRGHYPLMIEAVLSANGFPEAAEWIDQPHIFRELKDIADRARKQGDGPSSGDIPGG